MTTNFYRQAHADAKYLAQSIIDDFDHEGDEDQMREFVWEVVDGAELVIYNYQAQKVAEAFDMDAFGESEITGERYNSYNEMAFEKLYELTNAYLTELISE